MGKVDQLAAQKKNNVFNVSVESTVKLAQRNAIGIENQHLQIAKAPYWNVALIGSRWYGNETMKRHCFKIDMQL